MLLEVSCTGTPFEIGQQHGLAAKAHIARCISFYAGLFHKSCHLNWLEVRDVVRPFEERIKHTWPALYDEMRGIAEGSSQQLIDIVALNVRTEIAFGKFSDGCTSLAWHADGKAFLSQNWDWQEAQSENLVLLRITQHHKPSIIMMTEAGIIGKMGLNSRGVGICLNAIRAKGMDSQRLPVHLAMRLVLESSSAGEAVGLLETAGVASPSHMLIADRTVAYGVETSSMTIMKLDADERGRVIHTNHYLLEHLGAVDTKWLEDSQFRVARMKELTDALPSPSWDGILPLFEDEENAPASICRYQRGESTFATLFNIVMELKEVHAVVRYGKPNRPTETLDLRL